VTLDGVVVLMIWWLVLLSIFIALKVLLGGGEDD